MPSNNEKSKRKLPSYKEIDIDKEIEDELIDHARNTPLIRQFFQVHETIVERNIELEKSVDANKSAHTKMELKIQKLSLILRQKDSEIKKLESEIEAFNLLLGQKTGEMSKLQGEKNDLNDKLNKLQNTEKNSIFKDIIYLIGTTFSAFGVGLIITGSLTWEGWTFFLSGAGLSIFIFIWNRIDKKF